MDKNMRAMLIGSGVVAAGVAATGMIAFAASEYLVRLALDRNGVRDTAKRLSRVSGSPLDGAMLARLQHNARLLKTACVDAKMTTKDGLTLAGHWRECPNAHRVIIAMHGWRSDWARDFGSIADFWYDSGCSVLYPEQRGQGSSEGAHMGFGLLERHDCRGWIDWVNRKTGGTLPVYLAGISMGATTVLMTGGMELPENVRGIMADCAFTSPDAIWHHVATHNLHLHYGLHAASADALCRKRIQIGAREYSTLDAMAECEVPVLFIHGTEDRFVPVEMTYENYKACRGPKHLLVVPGANHGMSYHVDRKGYEKAMEDFWDRYDKNTPA